MLFILFEGGFTGGSAHDNQNDLKIFSNQSNIIVVSIAYRLSIFGFFYMGTENAPGYVIKKF